jgi:hypothetical protein
MHISIFVLAYSGSLGSSACTTATDQNSIVGKIGIIQMRHKQRRPRCDSKELKVPNQFSRNIGEASDSGHIVPLVNLGCGARAGLVRALEDEDGAKEGRPRAACEVENEAEVEDDKHTENDDEDGGTEECVKTEDEIDDEDRDAENTDEESCDDAEDDEHAEDEETEDE